MTKKDKALLILKKLQELYPTTSTMLHYNNDWQAFVAVVLSAQTTDKQVNKVTKTLFKTYKTLNDYIDADLNEFTHAIKSIGLYKTKAKNILTAAKRVQDVYHGKLPDTIKECITLPGAGRKTANVVIGLVYGKAEGIAVDTHVTRLSRLLKLTTHNDPKKIEQDLMKLIPQNEWFHFTHRMIDYGRDYCPARKHDHGTCPLSIITS